FHSLCAPPRRCGGASGGGRARRARLCDNRRIALRRLPIPATPIYFQPLERALEPVVRYLSGQMLNAGCGARDISPFLRRSGVTHITRYDLVSDDPEVIIGPIESLPFEEGRFDSVLCNAVLEHVVDAEAAMRELARVVR